MYGLARLAAFRRLLIGVVSEVVFCILLGFTLMLPVEYIQPIQFGIRGPAPARDRHAAFDQKAELVIEA